MELAATASALGFFEQKFEPRTIEFNRPAGLLLYTDGWYEWRTLEGAIYGLEAFSELATGLMLQDRFSLATLLENLCGERSGPVFTDDVTGLWVSVGSPRTRVFSTRSTPGASRELAREAVAAIAEFVSDPDVLHDLDIVLTEACANVSRHAYGGGEGPLEVRLRVNPGQDVRLEVVDWGKGFGKGVRFENAAPDSECGRGMFIICKLSDTCELKQRGRENVLSITKQIKEESWKT